MQQQEEVVDDDEVAELADVLPKIGLKPGFKLPKSKQDWEQANEFFKISLDPTKEITNMDVVVTEFQACIYDNFADNFGNVNTTSDNTDLQIRYNSLSRRQLKIASKELKHVGRTKT